MVRRVPAPRVAHPFDVKRSAVLACTINQVRGDLNDRNALLTGDEPH